MLNVFDHQRFVVRCQNGSRTTRSFRELITATTFDGQSLDPDEPLRLDYPHVFFNVGAFGLLTYLIHVAFEPSDGDELAHRLDHPIPVDDYEAAVSKLRDHFTIDGPGSSRFMQGPPSLRLKNGKLPKPESVSTLLLTIRKNNPDNKMEWLNRPDATWAIAPEQAALLLFTRNTFYEGAGGKGYQKGTAGEVAIRTLLVERTSDGYIRLRRSVWLNTLHRRFQRDRYLADFAVDRDGFDGFMWERLPDEHVPMGSLTLRAGLGWMAAYHYLNREEIPEQSMATCIVTGRTLVGSAFTGVWKKSTGIAYGIKGDKDSDTRASRLFRHPNIPTFAVRDKKTGSFGDERQQTVDRTRGLADSMGAVFFGMDKKGAGKVHHIAPVLSQLYRETDTDLEDYYERHREHMGLEVFGFHMVGSMGGKHSGYEFDDFRYPVLKGCSYAETRDLLDHARALMHEASEQSGKVARLLQTALQETAGVSISCSIDGQGHLTIKRREKKTANEFAFGRDTLAAFWTGVEKLIRDFVTEIAKCGTDPSALQSSRTNLLQSWGNDLAILARTLYRPQFNYHSVQPRTMPFAHLSARKFYGTLKKITRELTEATEISD